jgi:hypothetical protein
MLARSWALTNAGARSIVTAVKATRVLISTPFRRPTKGEDRFVGAAAKLSGEGNREGAGAYIEICFIFVTKARLRIEA